MTADRAIRMVRVQDIDLEMAARHLDLPHDPISPRAFISGMNVMKRTLANLFKGMTHETFSRGVDRDRLNAALSGEEGIGRSWTMDSHIAHRFAGFSDGVILTGTINLLEVNWLLTIAVNTLSEAEDEVILNDGAKINLISVVDRNDQPLPYDLPATVFS